ncbi:MAG: hypothetical protein HXK63_01770 [Campylobacter sp.]|jgi:hypothetical protein|nr:hypothetical protein [uncultured Campylobacter sp.]MBF0983865.1 hypothetical protein [Campylobacter sp.]
MAVTPLGNTIFINQNVNMVSNKVADVQNRFDLQNLAAASLASDEKQEVSEVRPTEETYKIDPENEHEKQKGRQEQGELASEQKGENSDDEDKERVAANDFPQASPVFHHLDLKI